MPQAAPIILSSVDNTTNVYGIPDEVIEVASTWITSSPCIFVPILLAFPLGALVSHILTFQSKVHKSVRKSQNKWYVKFGLGLAWQALVLIPTYFAFYGNLSIHADKLLEIELAVLVFSFASIALIVFLITFLPKGGVQKK